MKKLSTHEKTPARYERGATMQTQPGSSLLPPGPPFRLGGNLFLVSASQFALLRCGWSNRPDLDRHLPPEMIAEIRTEFVECSLPLGAGCLFIGNVRQNGAGQPHKLTRGGRW